MQLLEEIFAKRLINLVLSYGSVEYQIFYCPRILIEDMILLSKMPRHVSKHSKLEVLLEIVLYILRSNQLDNQVDKPLNGMFIGFNIDWSYQQAHQRYEVHS